jgi:predicted acylesterase/phospholipase RssA
MVYTRSVSPPLANRVCTICCIVLHIARWHCPALPCLQVDFLSGTSVGGMLALMLAAGHTPSQCQELLRWGAPHIFGYFPWRIINPFKAKYSHEAKEQIMQEYFGDRTMMDLLKKCAVVAFRLDGRRSNTHSFFNKEGWRPAVFSNMPKASGVVEPDRDLLVSKMFLNL